ncbi:guanylate cyclase soluble subunit beta-2-like [Gigantopelta aegis]|uniref:guanylate cyclase soluble subunit beta-2-like n=1 Tax=Gigantopelta aegis TaxID=1735272 RepID=UPI001B88A981|nr:guanylate cyclase soluble subunit beta-2-like [Gigantopelta aegis]
MYGQIHCVVRELIQVKFGEETWEKVLNESHLDKSQDFLVFKHYEDALTFQLIGAVSKVLVYTSILISVYFAALSMETVLEVFGDYFLTYCLKHGYDKMLKTLGGDIRSFIQNLDSLHSLLALSYKNIVAPSFRCEDTDDGDLLLHYYTIRPGLYPIVLGLVKAVSRELYQQTIDIQVENRSEQRIEGGKTQEHTVFKCIIQRNDRSMCEVSTKSAAKSRSPKNDFHIDAEQFCAAFPYHIIFNEDLIIRQCGLMVEKMSSVEIQEGVRMKDVFTVIHPQMLFSIANIKTFINAVFLLQLDRAGEKRPLVLKGQMMWLEDTRHMIFIGSPRLTSLDELMEMNVFLADIPLYDVTRELVLLNQQRIAEIDVAKQLEETTNALKKTSEELEKEKKKTDLLLYQLLPPKVANQLKNGKQVEAEKFDAVTIMFSDIVQFTNMAAACSPLQIVNMLNKLYQKFDEKTNEHDVYKVETIGDAYMVVGGVPEKTTSHAEQVVSFAIDLIQEATSVVSPDSGKPIQIRIGVHSGPVVAGVVGMKMPRFCLFGDTVNTASRMESHGVPCRIHISSFTMEYLKTAPFQAKRRGNVMVKGKGIMKTYFIVAGKGRRVTEPDDEFQTLPVITDLSCEDKFATVTDTPILIKLKSDQLKSKSCIIS